MGSLLSWHLPLMHVTEESLRLCRGDLRSYLWVKWLDVGTVMPHDPHLLTRAWILDHYDILSKCTNQICSFDGSKNRNGLKLKVKGKGLEFFNHSAVRPIRVYRMMLCILTSKRVLPSLCPGRNQLFLYLSSFIDKFKKKTANAMYEDSQIQNWTPNLEEHAHVKNRY